LMYVIATGMVCPVGLTDESACAAMRAGISAFEELPYLDNTGEPIVGAFVPTISFKLKRDERLLLMLEQVILDCISKCKEFDFSQVPIFVCLAEEGRPGNGVEMSSNVINEIESRLTKKFHPIYSQVICNGHTSGFEAMGKARELMRIKGIESCLVCGVDSYINASSLLWLDQYYRLKTEDNSDGVIPGEAAAAVMVSSRSKSDATISISGLGFGFENANLLEIELPLMGIGLSQATKQALLDADINMGDIDSQFSDATGEQYGFKEHALMIGKVLRTRKEELEIWHFAENVGDTGSVSGLLQVIKVFFSVNKGYSIGFNALGLTSSINGKRAAAVFNSLSN